MNLPAQSDPLGVIFLRKSWLKKLKTKVETVLHEFKKHKLHSGSKKGPIVTNKDQALSIALSEARKKGEKVSPKKKGK